MSFPPFELNPHVLNCDLMFRRFLEGEREKLRLGDMVATNHD